MPQVCLASAPLLSASSLSLSHHMQWAITKAHLPTLIRYQLCMRAFLHSVMV